MDEEWRDVVGYSGRYEVSSLGRVRTARSGYVHRGAVNSGGYVVVCLRGEPSRKHTRYLHRLVCLAFNGPPPSRQHVVNHESGNKLDCRPQNLSWCTRAENAAHASALGLLGGARGIRNAKAKLTDEAVVVMRRRSRSGTTYSQLAREFGVSPTAAYNAGIGRTWKHIAF